MTLPGGGYNGSAIGYPQVGSANSAFIPQLWSTEAKRRLDDNLIARQIVRMLPTMAKKGSVLYIPDIGRLAVNDKVYNNPVTLQSRTENRWSITTDKYKEVSFMIEDIVSIQTSYPLREAYIKEAGYALARDIDSFILGLRADIQGYNSQSNVVYCTSDGTSSGTALALNRAAILAAKEILDVANVPESDRFLVVSPSQYIDLLVIPEFISKDYQGSSPTETGEVGRLYGIPVYKTSTITANSSTGYYNGDPSTAVTSPTPGFTGSVYFPTQSVVHFGTTITATSLTSGMKTAVMGHRDWARLVVNKEPSTEMSRENLFQADAVVMTQVYGAKTYRPDHAVLIHSA